MAKDLKALETNMRKLQQSCAELGSHKYFDEFLQIIHHPGWTTVARRVLRRRDDRNDA